MEKYNLSDEQIKDFVFKSNSEYAKRIWNAAIEEAAKFSEIDIANSAIGLGNRIRGLKK